jgi:hypothetical protein
MKQIILLIFLCLSFGLIFGQSPVFIGKNLHQDESKVSFYLLLNQDENDILSDLKEFVKPSGKLIEVSKDLYRLEKVSFPKLSENIKFIDIKLETKKQLLKVIFFFFDDRNIALGNSTLDQKLPENFVFDFGVFTQKSLTLRLSTIDLKTINVQISDAKQLINKIEKQLESNLKEQEKLGKKLDASPELLTKVLSEKEEIVEKLYNDNSSEIDSKTENDLIKASTKKEKEIVKIQKDSDKALSRLEKKEKEFELLKIELFSAKGLLKHLNRGYADAKENLNSLTK